MVAYALLLKALGERGRRLRLLRGLQQKELAGRAGIGLNTVRRFEATGQISSASLVRIAVALEAEEGVERLFEEPKYRSLDEALGRDEAAERKRVRRKG